MTPAKARMIDQDGCRVRVVHLERVARARREQPPARELEGAARMLKALGDPSRLRIVSALAGGEMCVCDLAAYTGLSESAVSHHLRRLRDLALVKPRRAGQILYYSLDDAHVSGLVADILEHVRHSQEG